MNDREPLPRALMVLISLLQGLGLLLLHQAIELRYWPHGAPHWLFAFYSVAFIWPTMLLLSLGTGPTRRVVKLTLPFALLAGLLGYYVGHQAIPLEHIRYSTLLGGYVLTMAIATFKVLLYSQLYATGERICYSALFRWSWRNFLTLALALLFALGLWLILMLWGALFRAIGIRFFNTLFQTPWFYYPILALAHGFGIIIFRNLSHIIDTIVRLQQALMTFLLVLLVLVSLLFLAALPFTGLEPLWNSGGSALILWMQALMLFFVNAVYQDNPQQRPYPLWLHRFVYLGVALLPVYSAIAFYGLSLRVGQHGWSLDRCWAFLIWFLLALFPLGYWWGIATRRDYWLQRLDRVNISIGLVVLAAMLLVNSPLLDFRKIVVNDQLQRLSDGRVEPDKLDIRYFRWHLAKPGYDALQEIKHRYSDSDPTLAARIDELYRDHSTPRPAVTLEEFEARLDVLGNDVPAQLLETILDVEEQRLPFIQHYYLLPVDLDKDGQMDYLLAAEQEFQLTLTLYYLAPTSLTPTHLTSSEPLERQWQHSAMKPLYPDTRENTQSLVEALKTGKIELIQPRWHDIEIGGARSRVEIDNR